MTTLSGQAIAKVTLEIPCLAEYVGVARLAVLGVANRLPFTYDEVEDVRLAVGEACTHAVERAGNYNMSRGDDGFGSSDCSITIVCTIDNATLTVDVTDTVPMTEDNAAANAGDDGIDYQELGTVLMEVLVDYVTFEAGSFGTKVRLVKTATQAN
jgi:serine/threonine-protein kinase RsbW